MNISGWMLWTLGALVGTHSLVRAQSAQAADHTAQASQVEEIYVARSVRESRVSPTEFCAQERLVLTPISSRINTRSVR